MAMDNILKSSLIGIVLSGFVLSMAHILPSEALAKKKHEKVSLTFLAAPVGSDAYNFASSLSDIIKKNHPWLRSSVVETMGGVDMMRTMSSMSPKMRKTHIAHGISAVLNLARIGKGPFGKTGSVNDWKLLFTMYNVCPSFMTLDSKIKSGKDLVGKKIGLPPRQHGLAKDAQFILHKVWGLKDKVKLVYMPMGIHKDALLDGTVDVLVAGGMYMSEDKVKVSPTNELILAARKNVFFLGIGKEEFEKARNPNSPLIWRPIKANAIKPGYPATDTGSMTQANAAYVWNDMDEDIAYQIVKVLAENAKKVEKYFAAGKAFKPESFTMNNWSAKRYHPGALKYLLEKGFIPSGTLD